MTWIIAAVVGPLQAGAFANFGWWRGAFFLYVPIGAAFLVGVLWKIPKTADEATAGSRALRFPIWRVGLLGLGVLCVGSSGLVESAALRTALIVTAGLIVWYAFSRDAQADNRLFPSQPLSLSQPVGLGLLGAYSSHDGLYLGRDLSAAGADRLARHRPALRRARERHDVDRLVDRCRAVGGAARQPRAQGRSSPDRSAS